MPVRLDTSSADFDPRFRQFLAAKREVSADVERATRAIVDDVAARGDAALIEATRKFDRLDIAASGLRVTAAEIDAAVGTCDTATLDALKFARDRIEAFHQRQLPKDERFTDALGVELGWRWSAVDAVGLYVPGGTAAYPSSVLMNAVPASVAGVPRVVIVVPSPDGKLNPLVLAAAHLGGVSEIYRVGGAQAASLDIEPVELLRRLDQGSVAARGHVIDNGAGRPLDIGGDLALGGEKRAKTLVEIGASSVPANGHGGFLRDVEAPAQWRGGQGPSTLCGRETGAATLRLPCQTSS